MLQSLSAARADELARRLDRAAREARPVAQLAAAVPDLDAAYAVQRAGFALRLARGERAAGVKLGFTSEAKARQMGVGDVILGRLSDAMLLRDGAGIDLAGYLHPRAEPEVAFLLGRPLAGAVSEARALAAVAAVAPALEVIDSRYRRFRFSLSDVVADNASAAVAVLGPWREPGADLADLPVRLCVDGRARQVGSTAAILGHPLRSLVAASRLLAASGERLEAGWVVLAGSACAAEPLQPGTEVSAEVESLGSARLRVRAKEAVDG